jgi:hypothetical protein
MVARDERDPAMTATPGSRFSRLVRRTAIGLGVALTLSLGGVSIVAVQAAPIPACLATQLSARITSWQGAAGSRIADVRLYNTSFVTCYVRNFPRVRLVSAGGAVLIGGPAASLTGAKHTITPLHYRHTMVQTSNYCGGAYTAPVTLTFNLAGVLGRVVAIPLSSTDTSGVPPCLGSPGSAGNIQMQAWV